MAAVRAILSTLNELAQGKSAFARANPWRREASAGVAQVAMPGPWDGPYAHAGPEPPLEDLLADPVVRSVMRADRVQPAELRRLLDRRQQRVAI